MSLVLTPLASDNFTRANENPLANPPWSLDIHGDTGLQVIGNVCEAIATSLFCSELYTGTAVPADQYSQFTLATTLTSGSVLCGVRTTDNGQSTTNMPGYTLFVSSAGFWQISDRAGSGTLATGSLTASAGDTFVLAAIGTTLYAFQNGVQLGSVTNASYASGVPVLIINFPNPVSATQISNFTCGSASTGTRVNLRKRGNRICSRFFGPGLLPALQLRMAPETTPSRDWGTALIRLRPARVGIRSPPPIRSRS